MRFETLTLANGLFRTLALWLTPNIAVLFPILVTAPDISALS